MKFIIIEKWDSYIVEAEDFDGAISRAWNNHNGYQDINAIIKVPEDI